VRPDYCHRESSFLLFGVASGIFCLVEQTMRWT
jgi:hypothetical protein